MINVLHRSILVVLVPQFHITLMMPSFFVRQMTIIVPILCKLLIFFSNISGQKINISKSKVAFSCNTFASTKVSILNIFGIEEMSIHEKYLGCPIFISHRRTESFNFIKEKLLNRLQGWKDSSLSWASRTVPIKSVFSIIPNCFMQSILLPKATIDNITKIIRDFWWGSSASRSHLHTIAWHHVTRPKD